MMSSVASTNGSASSERDPQTLSEIYHKHVLKQSHDKHRLDQAKAQLVANGSKTTELAVEYLNEGIARAYLNESRLNAITCVSFFLPFENTVVK